MAPAPTLDQNESSASNDLQLPRGVHLLLSAGGADFPLRTRDIARCGTALRIARLENVPVHVVSAELLVAIYPHLGTAVAVRVARATAFQPLELPVPTLS